MAYTWIANWNEAPRWPDLGLSGLGGLGAVRRLQAGAVARENAQNLAQQQAAQNAAKKAGRRRPKGEIGTHEEGSWPQDQTNGGMDPCPPGTVRYQGACAPTITGSGGGVTYPSPSTSTGGGVTQGEITTSTGGGVTQGPTPGTDGGTYVPGPPSPGPGAPTSDPWSQVGPNVGGGGSGGGKTQSPYADLRLPDGSGGGAPGGGYPLPAPPTPLLPGGGGSGGGVSAGTASGFSRRYAPSRTTPNPFATASGAPSARRPQGTVPRGAYLFPDMRLARLAYEAQAAAQQPQTVVQQALVQASAPAAPGIPGPYAAPLPLVMTPTPAAQAQEAGIATLRALELAQSGALTPSPPPKTGLSPVLVVGAILLAGGLVYAGMRA